MVRVVMHKIKHISHIDDFNIIRFCQNTLSTIGPNVYDDHRKLLHTFHDKESIYEHSFETYSAYISYAVIKDAILTDKSILTYEQYVYNVLNGYYQAKFGKKCKPYIIARVWTTITYNFKGILDICSQPDIKTIDKNKRYYVTYNHLNSPVTNISYYLDVLLTLHKEDKVDVVVIVPKLTNITANTYIMSLIKYFGSTLDNIYVVSYDLNSHYSDTNLIHMDRKTYQTYQQLLKGMYIDFNQINIHNCAICPYECSSNQILKERYLIRPLYNTRLLTPQYRK